MKKIQFGKLTHPVASISSALALLLALPGAAFAQEIYLGAGYGWTENQDVDVGEDTDNGWKAFVGGNAWRVLGWEVGYVDLGEYGTGLASVDAKGWTVDLLAGVPVGPVNPFIKVGALYADVEGPVRDDQSWELKYGAGVGFDFNKNLGVRLEYERYQLENNDAVFRDSDIDMASVSLIGKFPVR